MVDIRHRIGIEAPQAQVHQALATTDGVASWWSRDVEGDAGEGGKLAFSFGRPDRRLELEVMEVNPDRVVWRCLYGPDEWLDTTIAFELDHHDGETVVLFTHAGWREAVPFEAHCSTKWAYFLIGLKLLMEGGETSPAPSDLHISRWS
jgi:uncharacterized protein YndB with AHSA1/START domain